MDVWKTYDIKDLRDVDGLVVPSVPEEIREAGVNCAKETETIQNAMQLFEMFIFNIELFQEYCTPLFNDSFIKRSDGEPLSIIEINTFIINIISAGKNCIDFIENTIADSFGEDERDHFRERRIYTIEMGYGFYRFLYELRNYGQHGNLLVSQNERGGFCFDLDQLFKPLFYTVKKEPVEWMRHIETEIREKFDDRPRLSVTHTISSYVVILIKLFLDFLTDYKTSFINRYVEYMSMILQCPECIMEIDGVRMAAYSLEDENLHLLFLDEDFEAFYEASVSFMERMLNKFEGMRASDE